MGYKRNRHNLPTKSLKNSYTPGWIKMNENRKLIIYLGTFGITCEPLLVLKVAKIFHEAGLNEVCFVLAGTGEQEKAIHQEAAGLPNVVLPGWVNDREIKWLLEDGHLGLSCYVDGAPQSIPNKFFEYLSAGIPVVSSLKGEISNMIKKYRLGLNYRAGDRNSLFYCIKKVLDRPNLREVMSRNALKFFRDFGDADRIYENYAQHIERLVHARKCNLKSKPY
jgi:glycosyltransferase involved in cell wall biosynthesis